MSARTKGRGGARAGAGRKAGSLPPDLLAILPDIKQAIQNPIKLARYYSTALALLTDARIRAGASRSVTSIDKLLAVVRGSVTASSKIIPADIQFHAAQLLRDDEDEMKRDKGPDEEERPAGKPDPVRASRA